MRKQQGIISAVIVSLIALTFITAMTGILNPQTDWSSVDNESEDISDLRIENGVNINESYTLYVDYDYSTTGNTPIRSYSLSNGTDDATETTDYVVNLTEGSYTLVNSTYWHNSDNSTLVSYEYKDSDYIENNFGRVIAGLIIGFAALVVLAYLVSWVMKQFSEEY